MPPSGSTPVVAHPTISALLEDTLLGLDDLRDGFYVWSEPDSTTVRSRWGSLEGIYVMYNSSDHRTIVRVTIAVLPVGVAVQAAKDLSQKDLDDVQADLRRIDQEYVPWDADYGDVRMLEAGGIGDGAYGFHVAVGNIAGDTFGVVRGKLYFQIAVDWNRDVVATPAADARALAELMDAKVQRALAQASAD